MSRPRVYAAHPVSCYRTDHEARCLAALRGLLPHCDLYDPADRCRNAAAWQRAWPRVLRTLSGLVVFAAEDDTIGAGCLRELGDALACGLPALAVHRGTLHEIDGVRLLALPWRSTRHLASLLLGPAFEPSPLFPSVFDGPEWAAVADR